MTGRKRILVVHPRFTPVSGAGGVCAWVLEALRRDHDVTLLCWSPPDFATLNRYFGTALTAETVRVEQARPALPAALRRRGARWLSHALLMRAARRRKPDMDLLISTAGEGDLGGGGVQYIHTPHFVPPPPGVAGLGLRLYRAGATVLTGTSVARMRSNVTLVNSDWTGARVRELDPITCFPPAPGTFPDVPWTERGDGFVCIGRIARDKRYELLVDIVAGVRARGHDSRLYIVGTADDPGYEAELAALARTRPWVTMSRGLPRAELSRLLASQRYGLHGKAEEHFGMSVAEAVRAGAIPFVPDGGGQVEIVADPRLTWRTRDDAIEKIARVLGSPALQEELRGHLAARQALLSPEHFVAQVRGILDACPTRSSSSTSRRPAA